MGARPRRKRGSATHALATRRARRYVFTRTRPGRTRGHAMPTIRLTSADALVRYLAAQRAGDGGPLFAGVWAIFGHGNVAALGHALHTHRDTLPTFRGHNEQAMAHAAIAFAKA